MYNKLKNINKIIILSFFSFNIYAFEIYAEVNGGVTFHKQVNERFNKNELLISIDDTIAKLNLHYEKALLNSYKQDLVDKKLAYQQEQELYDRLVSSKKKLDKVKLELVYIENNVKIQQAKVNIAKYNITKYQIKAPFDGKVKSTNLVNTINNNFTKELMVIEKDK